MLAAALTRFGNLSILDLPMPEPINSDDVVVKIASAGVCRTDLETIDGSNVKIHGKPAFPYVPGHENAGWVHAVGADVTKVKRGDAVILFPVASCGRCDACRVGQDTFCGDRIFPGVGAQTWGGFAEYVRTRERAVLPVPPDSDLIALSPYTDAGITAYHAIKRVLPVLTPDATAVVVGSGGVGNFAVQLLRHLTAARVVVIEPDAGRAQLAHELGAHLAIPDHVQAAVPQLRRFAPAGATVVFDFVGNDESARAALEMVARRGVYSAIGTGGDIPLTTLRAVVDELTVVGNLVGTFGELQELVAMHGRGLRSVHQTYPLHDAERAVHDLRTGNVSGRAVLIP